MKIQAYLDEWSRLPGGTVQVAVSTRLPELHASLVKLVSGPGTRDEYRVITQPVPGALDVTFPGRVQTTAVGSYAELPLSIADSGALTVHAWFRSTTPQKAQPQSVFSIGSDAGAVSVMIANHKLAVTGPGGEFTTDATITQTDWYSLALILDGANATVEFSQVTGYRGTPKRLTADGAVGQLASINWLRLATAGLSPIGSPVEAFNGKIENPSVHRGALSGGALDAVLASGSAAPGASPIAAWDFSQKMDTQTLVATTGADGFLPRGGDRGVTGHNWTGKDDSFLHVPEQYAAVHFHDDDMVDAGWDYDFSFTVPAGLKSGVYAVKLEGDDAVDHYPLFVRPEAGKKAAVLFLAPTNSYLAYANDRLAEFDLSAMVPHQIRIFDEERYLLSHDEFGRSCYDTHSDGSPNRFSSRRRPLVNVRPAFPNYVTDSYRHFAADLYLIEMLEKRGIDYDVITDEDVEREGVDAFTGHKVVVTGSHPEYWTFNGQDALEEYLYSGGKLMYLGGNGFYWVTTLDSARPWIVEVRRDNAGTRCWNSPPGERTHVYGGVPGGIWRYRGRGPNRTTGVGFATQGFNLARPYKRTEASFSGPLTKFFDGIDEEIIGTEGHILHGASGDEIDRWDVSLGSPEHSVVLASANGFANEYQLVIEDQLMAGPNMGGQDQLDLVRSDITYTPIDGGGAIFSVGSIAWIGAIGWNECDNNIERLTRNVLLDFSR